MPTVFRESGYRFYFYSHEPNGPVHVHVEKGDAAAKFWLNPVALARNMGFNPRELNSLHRIVRTQRKRLMEAWHGHFGSDG
jgi:hypothetical protein